MKIFGALITVLLVLTSCSADFLSSSNKRIVFFGDSITEAGIKKNGYISLISDSLKSKNPSSIIIGAGISGNKVPDLQSRLEKDVLSKEPTLVFIYIGINDVWHSVLPGLHGTPVDEFEKGLNEIISRIQSLGAKVILCTPSVIGERWDGSNQLDKQLDEYASISRKIASATNSELCDLRMTFIEYLKINNPDNLEKGILTYDGVHLNDPGNMLVANEMLKFLK